MPWRSSSVEFQRLEFVRLVDAGGVSFAELCRRFGISRPTGYKWVERFTVDGVDGLVDRSRAPRSSPIRTPVEMEELVCSVRRRFPVWGGRKIRGFLLRAGHVGVPAPSTITQILRRNGLMAHRRPPRRDFVRFERSWPNELWAMDFKGDFGLTGGGRCHPFGVIDDHSRYSVSLAACPNQRAGTVREHLETAFETYGLPDAMLMDNGSPWGDTPAHRWNPVTVWLTDLDIEVIHSRPHHPQTNGKKERLHHTLEIEVLATQPTWSTLGEVQAAFDNWNPIYNMVRPHEALGETVVPSDRYQPSPRPYPATIPPPVYPDHWHTRIVAASHRISFLGHRPRIGRPFQGKTVGIARTTDPNTYHVYYRHHHIKTIHL